jgi:hypothetical protein
MPRLVTLEIIMQEYEDAKRSNCLECAGLGYILEGESESLEDLTATHCKCKRGRSLQTAHVLTNGWFYHSEHGHDPGFFDGVTEEFTLK